MKGYVYILRDSSGRYYVGSTTDVERRMKQHGRNHTHTTKRMSNPIPVLIQEYDSIDIAHKVERKIKKLKRKDYIEMMIAQ